MITFRAPGRLAANNTLAARGHYRANNARSGLTIILTAGGCRHASVRECSVGETAAVTRTARADARLAGSRRRAVGTRDRIIAHLAHVADRVDAVEPGEGAHVDPDGAAESLRKTLREALASLEKMSSQQIIEDRYDKFRRMGAFFAEQAS